MKPTVSKLAISLGAIAFLQCADIARAAVQTDTAAPSAPAAADAASDNVGLKDIIVTATKRETNLQKTPIAISVLNPEMLENRHVQSLIDLADGGVPSLRVTTFEARQSALTVGIRGIVPFDQNQTARDSGVGVYIDGVYLGRSQGLNAALFDVQRIEVLRGPQGTLFGRNTEGGAVSIVTRDPTGEFGGRVEAGVGNFGSRTGEFHIDLPTFANIAFKVDGLYQHQDPTVRNPLAGETGWNQYNRVGGRISAKWTPSSDFSALLSYDNARDENTPNFSQLISYNPQGRTVGTFIVNPTLVNPNLATSSSYILVAPGTTTACSVCIAPLSPLVTPTGANRVAVAQVGVPQQTSVDKTEGVSLTLKYKLAPDIELRSISALRRVETDQWDNSGGPARTIFAPFANFGRYSLSFLKQHQFSQELQLVGQTDQIDWVIGGYYFNEYAEERAATPNTNKWNADGKAFTLNSPVATGTISSSNNGADFSSQFIQRNSYARAKSYAAFGQATYTPSGFDQFHLTLGGRYTHDNRTGLLFTVQGLTPPGGGYGFTFKNNRFDPLVIAAFDVTPDVNVFAKYATGYRAGGANDRSSTFRAFGPETVKAYEVGAKMNLLDNRLRINLAAYIMNRTGTQTDFDFVDTVVGSPTNGLHTQETVSVAALSKIRGFEADITAKITNELTVGASYAYTSVKVPSVANPLAGATFGVITPVFTVFTPEHAASGNIDYVMPLSSNGTTVRFHIDGNYASSQYSFQDEATLTDPSFVVNARLALADIPITSSGTKATLAVWARNLLDTTYIYRRSSANAKVLGDYGNFNPPRTFGVEGTIKF